MVPFLKQHAINHPSANISTSDFTLITTVNLPIFRKKKRYGLRLAYQILLFNLLSAFTSLYDL